MAKDNLSAIMGVLGALSTNVNWKRFTGEELSRATRRIQSGEGARQFEQLLRGELKLVEAASDMIVRRVTVDRSRAPQEALDATGRKQYTTHSVVDAMPRGEGENVELVFFELDYDPSTKELDAEYERRGLKADPFALAKHMQDDPAFADERPVACQWDLDENGRASYTVFSRWYGERSVHVNRYDDRWIRYYRFAGVCK